MLGIVILNYKTYEKTIECVDSIVLTMKKKYKIYIVDNFSPNNSFEILKTRYINDKKVKVLKAPNNGGFAKGNNIGIQECIENKYEYVLITNNDIIFTDNSIEKMYNFISNKQDVVIVGPKITKKNKTHQQSSVLREKKISEYIGISKYFRKSLSLDERNLNEASKVFSVSGCCFLVNLHLFKKIGAFDEGTFLYNEENILGTQAKTYNYDVYFLPSATVIHDHGSTSGTESMFVNKEFIKSALYYWKKYRGLNRLEIYLLWCYYTIRWLIKSSYSSKLREGWPIYFKDTIRYIFKNMNKKL